MWKLLFPFLALTVVVDGNPPVQGVSLVTVYKPGQAPSIPPGADCSGSSLTLVPRIIRTGQTFHTFRRNEAIALPFQGQEGARGTLLFSAPTSHPLGSTVANGKLVTLTSCAGNFDESSISANCRRAGINGAISYLFGSPDGSPRCFLNPAQTYYLSIRNFAAGSDSCPSGELCATALNHNSETP